jgi:hypothetical protein
MTVKKWKFDAQPTSDSLPPEVVLEIQVHRADPAPLHSSNATTTHMKQFRYDEGCHYAQAFEASKGIS